MCLSFVTVGLALALFRAPRAEAQSTSAVAVSIAPDTVLYTSGALTLRGLLYHPAVSGRHPAVLFLHGSGDNYDPQAAAVGPLYAARGYDQSALSPFFRSSLPGIWLSFSWHLVAVAGALGWASLRGSQSARPLLTFAAILVCADTVFVFSIAGLFAGTALLAAAALCAAVAAVRWPAD